MSNDFQQRLTDLIQELERTGDVPHLFLHCCCAPCSSYVLEYLANYFRITVFYYNPNIAPLEEYQHRVLELKRFVSEFPTKHSVTFMEGKYEPERFYGTVRGLEDEPEGGARCRKCFELRLGETARIASGIHADYFTTTLSISPLKDSKVLNEVGEQMAKEHGIKLLPSDFKKRGGYGRSVELSREYGMYRQNFCGCVYSMPEKGASVEAAQITSENN